MAKPDTMTQVKNGFLAAGVWLLGLGWLGLVFAGMGIAFSASKYPPAIGYVLLAIAAVIMVGTAQRWVKALPGLLGLASLNALVSVFSGHATNLPSASIPRLEAVLATLLLATSTALSLSFTSRELNIVDRLAFLIYASCILWGAVDHRVILPLQMGVATLCLFFAWAYDRLRQQRG